MTNFNILYGDVEIYDINIALLKTLDDLHNENYMENYNIIKRYDNYSSFKEERYFYKVKCNKNSLIKYEDAYISYIEENIIMKTNSKKLILDFSKYEQKKLPLNQIYLYI